MNLLMYLGTKLLTYSVLGALFMSTWLYTHEMVHVVIAGYNNCTDVYIDWFNAEGVATISTCQNYPDWFLLANSINEVIGYTVALPLWLIIFVLIVFYLEDNLFNLRGVY